MKLNEDLDNQDNNLRKFKKSLSQLNKPEKASNETMKFSSNNQIDMGNIEANLKMLDKEEINSFSESNESIGKDKEIYKNLHEFESRDSIQNKLMSNPVYNILKFVDDNYLEEEEEDDDEDEEENDYEDINENLKERKIIEDELDLNIQTNFDFEERDEKTIKRLKYLKKTKWGKIKYNIKEFLESKFFSILFAINIVIALFLISIAEICVPKEWDGIIDIVMLSVFIFFITEIVMHLIFIPHYRFSFFFYGDMLAMIGLYSEVKLIQGVTEENQDDPLQTHSNNDFYHIFVKNSGITKTIRVTSSGSRIGRIFSLLNVIGTLNVFQLGRIYKNNVNDFLEHSQRALNDLKKKEKIREMRRNTLRFKNNADKLKFLQQIQSVLKNNPEIKTIIYNKTKIDADYPEDEAAKLIMNLNTDDNKSLFNEIRKKSIQFDSNTKLSKARTSNLQLANSLSPIKQENSPPRKEVATIKPKKANIANSNPTNFIITEQLNSNALINMNMNEVIEEESSEENDNPVQTILSSVSNEEENEVLLLKSNLPALQPNSSIKKESNYKTSPSNGIINYSNKVCECNVQQRLNFENRRSSLFKKETPVGNFSNRLSLISKDLLIRSDNKTLISSKIPNTEGRKKSILSSTKSINEGRKKSLLLSSAKSRMSISEGRKMSLLCNAKNQEILFNHFKEKGIYLELCPDCNSYIIPINNLQQENRRKSNYRKPSVILNEFQGTSLANMMIPIDNFASGNRMSIAASRKTINKTASIIDFYAIENFKNMNEEEEVIKVEPRCSDSSSKRSSVNNLCKKIDKANFKINVLDELKALNKEDYAKIGVGISKVITIRLVMLILMILFVLPYLDVDNYMDIVDVYSYEIDKLDSYLVHSTEAFINHYYHTLEGMPNILIFGFLDRETMCQYKDICEKFPNETIYFDEKTFHHTRSANTLLINTTNIYFIYSNHEESVLDAILSIFKTLFVSVLLFIGSFLFLKDSNKIAVLPLEESYSNIQDIKFNQEKIFIESCNFRHFSYLKYYENKNENEIFVIKDNYIRMQKMIVKLFGARLFSFLEKKIFKAHENQASNHLIGYKILDQPFFSIYAIVMVIELVNFDSLTSNLGNNFLTLYSKVIEMCDLTSFEYFGELIKVEQNKIFIIWDQGRSYTRKYRLNRSVSSNESNSLDNLSVIDESMVSVSSFGSRIENESPRKQIESEVKENDVEVTDMPYLKNHSVMQINCSNLALITSIKIISRCLNKIEDTKLDFKISINKGYISNFATNSSDRLESVFTGKVFDQVVYMNKTNKYSLNILFTDSIYKELASHLKRYTRDVTVIKSGNKEVEKYKKVYAFDLDYNKPTWKNPYLTGLKISKKNALVIRKTFIELMNIFKFEISKIIKYDSEIIFSKLTDISFINYYNEGLESYKMKDFTLAQAHFKKALIFKPNDPLTKMLLAKIENI